MNKAVRTAIAAAFGVATAIPALAGFENTGPDPQPGQGMSSLSDISPPGLSGSYSGYGSGPRFDPGASKLEWSMADSTDQFGSPAGNMFYDREILLGSNPGSVGVTHGETVKFVTADGREFRWRFDTLKTVASFPLARIAPDGTSVGQNAMVYVNGSDAKG